MKRQHSLRVPQKHNSSIYRILIRVSKGNSEINGQQNNNFQSPHILYINQYASTNYIPFFYPIALALLELLLLVKLNLTTHVYYI